MKGGALWISEQPILWCFNKLKVDFDRETVRDVFGCFVFCTTQVVYCHHPWHSWRGYKSGSMRECEIMLPPSFDYKVLF